MLTSVMSHLSPVKPVPGRLWRWVRLAPEQDTCKAFDLEASVPWPFQPYALENCLAEMVHAEEWTDMFAESYQSHGSDRATWILARNPRAAASCFDLVVEVPWCSETESFRTSLMSHHLYEFLRYPALSWILEFSQW